MDYIENDVAKYHKKKESDTSKSNLKSRHKHIYDPCLFRVESSKGFVMCFGSCCSECGKIGNNRILSREEYKDLKCEDLPIYTLSDYFQKYVGLVSKEMDEMETEI